MSSLRRRFAVFDTLGKRPLSRPRPVFLPTILLIQSAKRFVR